MKSKLIALAGLALASALSSCASYEPSIQTTKRNNNPKIIEITSTSGEVYTLSQEEAERQILKWAWRSEREDSWAYIKPENKEGYLLDIGKNGKPTEVEPDSYELISHLARLYNTKKEVIFIHIHPFKRNKTENLESIMLQPLPATPSNEDFKYYRVLNKDCKRLNATLKYGCVISPSQKSIFTRSQDTKDEMLKNIYEEMANDNLSTEDLISRFEKVGCTLRFESFTNEQLDAALADQDK